MKRSRSIFRLTVWSQPPVYAYQTMPFHFQHSNPMVLNPKPSASPLIAYFIPIIHLYPFPFHHTPSYLLPTCPSHYLHSLHPPVTTHSTYAAATTIASTSNPSIHASFPTPVPPQMQPLTTPGTCVPSVFQAQSLHLCMALPGPTNIHYTFL